MTQHVRYDILDLVLRTLLRTLFTELYATLFTELYATLFTELYATFFTFFRHVFNIIGYCQYLMFFLKDSSVPIWRIRQLYHKTI